MNSTTQQSTVPSFRDWTEPQTLPCNQLAEIMAGAAKAGYVAFRMDRHPAGYRLMFQRVSKPHLAGLPKQSELTLPPKSTI